MLDIGRLATLRAVARHGSFSAAALELGYTPSAVSQQLAVLRRSGIVTATRDGSTVVYALAGGDVADLMKAARRILTQMLSGRNELLAELLIPEVAAR